MNVLYYLFPRNRHNKLSRDVSKCNFLREVFFERGRTSWKSSHVPFHSQRIEFCYQPKSFNPFTSILKIVAGTDETLTQRFMTTVAKLPDERLWRRVTRKIPIFNNRETLSKRWTRWNKVRCRRMMPRRYNITSVTWFDRLVIVMVKCTLVCSKAIENIKMTNNTDVKFKHDAPT